MGDLENSEPGKQTPADVAAGIAGLAIVVAAGVGIFKVVKRFTWGRDAALLAKLRAEAHKDAERRRARGEIISNNAASASDSSDDESPCGSCSGTGRVEYEAINWGSTYSDDDRDPVIQSRMCLTCWGRGSR